MSEQRVIVARAKGEIATKDYRVDIDAGGHDVIADEPERAGGGNEGPSPYGLLLSGLAACTAITLRMYCERKDWPLAQATVDLRFTRGDDDSRIDRVITLEGDLTPEQEARLAEVAERTPVTLTLKSGVEIRTDLRRASLRPS
jgi:putative redox protein